MSEREPYPSEKQDRFIVRLPDGLRDRIKAAAEASGRSMNSEIVQVLEERFPDTSAKEWASQALRAMARQVGEQGLEKWTNVRSGVSMIYDLPEDRFQLLQDEDRWITIRYDDGGQIWMSISMEMEHP